MRKAIATAFCGVALLTLVATLAQRQRVQRLQAQRQEHLLPDAEQAIQVLRAELLKERLAQLEQSSTPWPGFQRCFVGSASCLELDERPFVLCKASGSEACDRSGTFVPLASN